MRSARIFMAAAMTWAAMFAAPPVTRAQTATGNQLLFDESGRQLAHPNDRQAPGKRANAESKSAPARPLGKVVIDQNVTVGVETERKIKADQFPDGTRIPGIDSQRRDTNAPFMGFSLSVPTDAFRR